MKYTELTCRVKTEEQADILIAYLAEFEYESFANDDPTELKAYIKTELFDENIVKQLQKELKDDIDFTYSFINCPEENWNQKWEENYQAVLIDEKCYIRAPFHSDLENIEYDIIIQPKMSFGTAHHETTSQIISELMTIDCKDKLVLDMGCGTGVIAILAAKMGAKLVWAIDNDEWAYENTLENIERNNVEQAVKAFLGDANTLENIKFDIIIANINRNILLEDMKYYVDVLENGGIILFSGFYEEDLQIIKEYAERQGLKYISSRSQNKWVVANFVRI
ncbi:MAG: 50S ribosomal protein L11 methyltransferase [Bacteroidales bacterium]|jgi:ribosomal protein L11 methyltransferase|nr:50S ribosomal protein L11 methyltransferase [Bacteroidales bacterium]